MAVWLAPVVHYDYREEYEDEDDDDDIEFKESQETNRKCINFKNFFGATKI